MSQSETSFYIGIKDLTSLEKQFWQQLKHALYNGNSFPLAEIYLDIDENSSLDEFLCGIEIEVDEDTVVISSSIDGNADHAAQLIQAFLSEFTVDAGGHRLSPHEPLIFEVSIHDTNSPGGVGFYVTSTGYTTLSSADVGRGVLVSHATLDKIRQAWSYGENVTSIDLAVAIQALLKEVDGDE